MDAHQVFIIGDSLFAETLAKLLVNDVTIQVEEIASSLEEALPRLKANPPDVVIVAGVNRLSEAAFAHILSEIPDISILCIDLGTNDVQVVTNQRVSVHTTSDLLAVIGALPKQV